MKKIIIIATLLSLFSAAGAQDTVRMSLDSCLRYAYAHNLTVQTAQLSSQSAEVALEGARLKFAPSLNANASENISSRGGATTTDQSLGLNAGLTLFSGLSNVNNYRRSSLQADQSTLKVRQSENSVSSQIVQTYLTILMNQEKMLFQQEVLATAQQQLAEGELKHSVGKILESDYLLLEASCHSAQADIEATRLSIADNRLALKQLLCFEGSEVLDVVKGELPDFDNLQLPELAQLVSRACDTLPNLKIAQMNVDMAEYGVKIARASYSPTLSASAGASYYGGGSGMVDNNGAIITNGGLSTSAVLSLNVPILNRGTSRTQYRQSKIELQEAQLQYSQSKLDLQKEVEGQYISTQQAYSRFLASEKLAEAYKANYEVYVLKYGAGAVTTVDMLQQQDRYLSSLNDYLQNKYTLVLDLKILDLYQGNEIKL